MTCFSLCVCLRLPLPRPVASSSDGRLKVLDWIIVKMDNESGGLSQKEEEKREPKSNPKFRDCFSLFGFLRSRHFEELVCRLGVPFSSSRQGDEEKGASSRAGQSHRERALLCSLAGENRRQPPPCAGGRGSPRPKACAVCSWPQKRCRRFGTRERVSWDRRPVEEDEVRSKR